MSQGSSQQVHEVACGRQMGELRGWISVWVPGTMSLSQSPREGEVLLESTYSLAVLTGLPSCCLFLLASQGKRKHVVLCYGEGVIGLQWDTFVIYIYDNVMNQGPVHSLQWAVLALRNLPLLQADNSLLLRGTQIWWFLCLKTINWIIFSFL